MKTDNKEDLRVLRTKESIRSAFINMISEMDLGQVTIKELAERARINRKTFYLHYDSLDDLIKELQSEMANEFIKRTNGLNRPKDMDKITREFFLFSEELGKLGEILLTSGSYHYISQKITNDILAQTWQHGNKDQNASSYTQNIIMTFVSQSTLAMYRQWVSDGKKIPVEDIINIASQLICEGLDNFNVKDFR